MEAWDFHNEQEIVFYRQTVNGTAKPLLVVMITEEHRDSV
jgi:hypothetical protein